MDAFDAYVAFLAIKQHFESDSYNYFEYNGKVNTSKQAFAMRKDKLSFYQLVRKYKDPVSLYVANFVYDDIHWVGDLMTDKAEQNYRRWLKNNNALGMVFKEDMRIALESFDSFNPKQGNNPKLLDMVYQGSISIESLLILDRMGPFLHGWNKKISDTIIWPSFYKKITKYKSWIAKLELDKFKVILKEVCNETKDHSI